MLKRYQFYQHAIKKSIKNVLIFPSFVLIWHECQSLLASGKWYPLWPTFQALNYYSILWLGYNLQIPEIFLSISNIFICCINILLVVKAATRCQLLSLVLFWIVLISFHPWGLYYITKNVLYDFRCLSKWNIYIWFGLKGFGGNFSLSINWM